VRPTDCRSETRSCCCPTGRATWPPCSRAVTTTGRWRPFRTSAAADLEASRKCAAFLALPVNADLGLKLAWEGADLIWQWAGDTATDWNHYSKRTILSGILIPALTMRLFDGRERADAFVAARIENVMTFEKWKAGKDFDAPLRKMTDALSRMRYGAKV
jgi:ubiquinone biosynthesis protein COQ9